MRLRNGSGIWGTLDDYGLPRELHWLRLTVWPAQYLKHKEIAMRSDLVFRALSQVKNRYQLCQLASKATRKLHKPNTRLQDTTNEVLVRFESTNPKAEMRGQAPSAQPVERRRAA